MGMSKQGAFMICCAEQYKLAKHLTGKQLAELFSKYQVWEYVYTCYEALVQQTQTISSTILIYISKSASLQWHNKK